MTHTGFQKKMAPLWAAVPVGSGVSHRDVSILSMSAMHTADRIYILSRMMYKAREDCGPEIQGVCWKSVIFLPITSTWEKTSLYHQ